MSQVVGYSYKAENLCPDCILGDDAVTKIGFVFSVEGVLDVVAGFMGINREDESSFDSGDFPKVIFPDQVQADEKCAKCGYEL